jgi:hypothetical protein
MTTYLYVPGLPVAISFENTDVVTITNGVKTVKASGQTGRTFSTAEQSVYIDFATVGACFATYDEPAPGITKVRGVATTLAG